MKSFLLLLNSLFILSLSGCTPRYDYAVHKPKIKYNKPSRKALSQTLIKKLGSRYIWAEEGPRAFDCSGLVYYSYGRMNLTIPRTAAAQAKVGKWVPKDKLEYGDLLFFNTSRHSSNRITHVGIYIGHDRFEHASTSKKGVIISKLNSKHYSSRLVTCRRYLADKSDDNTPVQTNVAKVKALKYHPTTNIQVDNIPTENIQMLSSNDIQEQTINHDTHAVSGSKHGHYVQVGSFAQTPSQSLLHLIRENGYIYTILEKSGLKKILIGPYRSKIEAKRSLDDIRATIRPDAFELSI